MNRSRRRGGRGRLLVLANPNTEPDSDEEQQARPPPVTASSAPALQQSILHVKPQPTHSVSYQPQRSSPRSEVSSSRGEAHRPSPIPGYDRPPYSESSRSESTPPPVTPGQPLLHDPYGNLSVNTSPEDPHRTLMPHSHNRHGSETQFTSSPRSPVPSSPQLASDKLLIMATVSEHFSVVDITGARSAEYIRERLFAKLQISDHDQHHYAIFRTVLGEFPERGAKPLTSEELLRACLQEGDSKGSLKFLVMFTSGRRLPPINTVTAVPPMPIPPATGDGFSPSLVRRKGGHHRAEPSLSSASGDRQPDGYLASESELDPPDRSRELRSMDHAYSNSPPSARDVTSPRQYLPGASNSSRHHAYTASSSPTSVSLLSRSRLGNAAPTPYISNGPDPESASFFRNQPLPPTPLQTGSSRQNSLEQEQADLAARAANMRPSSSPRSGSVRKGRPALPNIPPPPTAPPPVPVGTPASVPRPNPRSRGPGTPQSLANTPLNQAPSRGVNMSWLHTGQTSKQISPQHLKPARSMDMLRGSRRSTPSRSETPTSPHPHSLQRGGDQPQSADRASGLVGRGPGGSRTEYFSPANGGRPAWSDTDRPSAAAVSGARVKITSSSVDSLGSSSSTDFERPPASPLSPADESTLKPDDRSHYAALISGSQPPVLPPITTQNSSLLPTNANLAETISSSWGDDDDTIWVHPPSKTAPSTPLPVPPPPPQPVIIPPDNEEDSIWVKPPKQQPQPGRINVEIDNPAPSSASHSPTESSPKQPRPPKPRPQSRFINRESVTWNVRPPAQEVYEHLEDFFPEHDLDKPLLESATGGGDSPATPVSATAAQPSPLTRGGAGMKHRRTIRHVAREGKKILDRTSKIESPQAAMLRKRSTKLWGTKVEEVTPGAGRSGPPSAVPESPNSTTAKPVTRWIKGDLIGKGTYGKVFLALNANTGEMIAVKQVELPKTVSDKADARQTIVVDAIKSESTTLRDLDHPNVVQYLGFEETTDYFNLFLEYVPGGSIGGILRKHGKFDEEVAKCFTLQMLSGLEYLHSRGIWHRDLKGDNILVDPSGVCKISDFGISKRTEDVERFDPSATNMQGSIFWMAPEVLSNAGMGYNAKIDIWSLGCVYVEMMTGRRPWENENFVAVMYKLSTTKEAPPIPQLSDIGQEFVSMCFEKDPNMRPTAAVLRKHAYLSPRPGWVFQPGSFRAD